ncbi:MAG TPA: thioredoxin-dependent thiol peroxidase [Polyangia bacterium]|nr:thioredoxin-dependent thiol peroxidase [Polyangia bacterium]
MSTSLAIGRKAPAFSLPNQDGQPVKLSSFKGRWLVLYFYPKDNTGGCTTQACEFTDSIKDFEKLDAAVLGCSPDAPATHQKFIAKFKLKLTLLSDEDHAVMDQYGAWGEKSLYGRKFMGVIRSTVIIDPQGNVAHHYPKVKAAGHAEVVRAKLTELRAAAA